MGSRRVGGWLFKRQLSELFNKSHDEKVTNIRVTPSGARAVSKSRTLKTLHHFNHRPCVLIASDGGVILSQLAIIGEACLMPQQLTQRKRLVENWLVQFDQTVTYQ